MAEGVRLSECPERVLVGSFLSGKTVMLRLIFQDKSWQWALNDDEIARLKHTLDALEALRGGKDSD